MIIFVVSGRLGAVGFYGVRDVGFQAFRVVGSVGLGSSRLLGLVPQELQCGCANSEFCALCYILSHVEYASFENGDVAGPGRLALAPVKDGKDLHTAKPA